MFPNAQFILGIYTEWEGKKNTRNDLSVYIWVFEWPTRSVCVYAFAKVCM